MRAHRGAYNGGLRPPSRAPSVIKAIAERTRAASQHSYEALDLAGYDVFLDTHRTIKPGEPFQEVLWHRLADTDVVVLLDTPDFLGTRWTEEELARANNSNLQILQVLWPDQKEVSSAAFSTFHPLKHEDFLSAETLVLPPI